MLLLGLSLTFFNACLHHRLSSQRLASMKRPSTSCSMSLKMAADQTMHFWKPQGVLQVVPTTLTRMKRGSALKECGGSISSGPMTELTTTSDPAVSPLFSALTTTSASVTPLYLHTDMSVKFIPSLLPQRDKGILLKKKASFDNVI